MPPDESEPRSATPVARPRRRFWRLGLLAVLLAALAAAGLAFKDYEFGKRQLPPSGG